MASTCNQALVEGLVDAVACSDTNQGFARLQPGIPVSFHPPCTAGATTLAKSSQLSTSSPPEGARREAARILERNGVTSQRLLANKVLQLTSLSLAFGSRWRPQLNTGTLAGP